MLTNLLPKNKLEPKIHKIPRDSKAAQNDTLSKTITKPSQTSNFTSPIKATTLTSANSSANQVNIIQTAKITRQVG